MFKGEGVDISLLITGLDGGPYYMRFLTADALVNAAKKSASREEVERIAGALRERGYTDQLREVTVHLKGLELPERDRKRSPLSRPPERKSVDPQKLTRK